MVTKRGSDKIIISVHVGLHFLHFFFCFNTQNERVRLGFFVNQISIKENMKLYAIFNHNNTTVKQKQYTIIQACFKENVQKKLNHRK